MLRNLMLAASVFVLGTSGLQAQTGSNAEMVSDALFAQAAAASGLSEVTISQIGLQKSRDPELKKFSQQMIEEHTKLNQELMSLASKKQMALPAELDARAQFCAQALKGASAEEFDACYAKAQLTAHLEAVETFKSESERGQDPEVKALAAKALPKIKEHLRMIKPIAMKLEKETASGDATH